MSQSEDSSLCTICKLELANKNSNDDDDDQTLYNFSSNALTENNREKSDKRENNSSYICEKHTNVGEGDKRRNNDSLFSPSSGFFNNNETKSEHKVRASFDSSTDDEIVEILKCCGDINISNDQSSCETLCATNTRVQTHLVEVYPDYSADCESTVIDIQPELSKTDRVCNVLLDPKVGTSVEIPPDLDKQTEVSSCLVGFYESLKNSPPRRSREKNATSDEGTNEPNVTENPENCPKLKKASTSDEIFSTDNKKMESVQFCNATTKNDEVSQGELRTTEFSNNFLPTATFKKNDSKESIELIAQIPRKKPKIVSVERLKSPALKMSREKNISSDKNANKFQKTEEESNTEKTKIIPCELPKNSLLQKSREKNVTVIDERTNGTNNKENFPKLKRESNAVNESNDRLSKRAKNKSCIEENFDKCWSDEKILNARTTNEIGLKKGTVRSERLDKFENTGSKPTQPKTEPSEKHQKFNLTTLQKNITENSKSLIEQAHQMIQLSSYIDELREHFAMNDNQPEIPRRAEKKVKKFVSRGTQTDPEPPIQNNAKFESVVDETSRLRPRRTKVSEKLLNENKSDSCPSSSNRTNHQNCPDEMPSNIVESFHALGSDKKVFFSTDTEGELNRTEEKATSSSLSKYPFMRQTLKSTTQNLLKNKGQNSLLNEYMKDKLRLRNFTPLPILKTSKEKK